MLETGSGEAWMAVPTLTSPPEDRAITLVRETDVVVAVKTGLSVWDKYSVLDKSTNTHCRESRETASQITGLCFSQRATYFVDVGRCLLRGGQCLRKVPSV